MSNNKTKEKLKESELLNIIKPPKPLKVGLPNYARDLLYMTAAVIIFFWCGASFHVLMYGYKMNYNKGDFKGINIDDVPYTCDSPPNDDESFFSLDSSSSAYCLKGFALEGAWKTGIFTEVIDFIQNTLKDTFSTGRYGLSRIISMAREKYKREEPKEGFMGFTSLFGSSLIAVMTVFGGPGLLSVLLAFYCLMNFKHFLFTLRPEMEGVEGVDDSTMIGNGNTDFISAEFIIKCCKLFYNILLYFVSFIVLMLTVPAYIFFAMIYWITIFVARGDSNSSHFKEGNLEGIMKILANNGKWIATLWLIFAGMIGYSHLGFGATIAAGVALLLHLGMNFFGYLTKDSKDEINI